MNHRHLCLVLLFLVNPAFAQVDQMMPPTGGPGGGQFAARCAIGEILTGFELRVADDVDAIRPVCAVPDSPTSISSRTLHPTIAGGPGGRAFQVVCPENTPGIAEMLVGWEGVQTYIVNNIRLYCGIVATNQLPAAFPTVAFDGPRTARGPGLMASFASPITMGIQRCPDGLIAVGIHGRSGKWLDAVGLVCGALPLKAAELPKPAAPGKPKLTASTAAPLRIRVEWSRPVPANNIEWYSIELLKDQRWVTLPSRYDTKRFQGSVEYPDVTEATQRQAFRVCAENAAQRSCSAEAWYYNFAKGQAQLSAEPNRATAGAVTARAGTSYNPTTAVAQAAGAAGVVAGAGVGAGAALPDLNALAARGAEAAMQDPLAAELRNRIAEGALRRGFDVGFGIWIGNAAPGPGKQKVHDALGASERPGFDIAAAFSLPRNKYAKLASVGAAIGNADPAIADARNAENDVFYWLGFDIASGIFGDPAAGSLGNTATGPGSLGIRNELNAAGQRGFNAATALHLGRNYK